MRNLRTIRYDAAVAQADITATCWDAGKDEVLATFGPTEHDSRIELARVVQTAGLDSPGELEYQKIASWDAPSPNPDLVVDEIVNLHYFADTLTACLVLAGGDIVIVQEDGGLSPSPENVHIEIVGSIDAGITAARWSPDEELLVITTKANTVVFMSRSFDGITDATMTAEDLKLSKHVSVGWGKKETQFQGKGAKALRDPTIPEKVDQGVLSPNDDGRTTISWRGDGTYVAVNSVESGSRRVIRVYTREGSLDSVSEPVDGLEGSLSWRPAGNLMAGVQRLSDRIDIVFFEGNGLRHGQFSLRTSEALNTPTDRISLQWNSDSSVLAVSFRNIVQLWTMGNYHWYLKQEILHESRVSHVVWHPEKALRLAQAASSSLVVAELTFTMAMGSLIPPHDYGAVAVIDGRTVKLTPFRTANIPPPMAMFELSFDSAVIDVAFSRDNSAMAVLCRREITLYEWQTRDGRSLLPKFLGKVALEETRTGVALQLCFLSKASVLLLHSNQGSMVSQFHFDEASGTFFVGDVSPLPTESALSLIAHNQGEEAFVQTTSGKLIRISNNGLGATVVKFPVSAPWAQVTSCAGELTAFGLSRNGTLYANSRLLTKNCTSFVLSQDHIIFTTSNYFLKFTHLTAMEDLEVPPDNPDDDERCRSIERGARLVTAMASNMSVVLQMPRGNLETIFPRAMVMAGIRQCIDEKNYGKAFAHCRTQRVDMNILYDYKPGQFITNVGLFLDQLKDVAHIDLFLSSLREEDVTRTIYRDTKPSTHAISAAEFQSVEKRGTASSKVNAICDAVLEALQSRKGTNLQNIITANVCKDPPALDDGLLVVAGLMQEDEALADRAVEHICFLQDVNRLYDHALGLYNLDLALLVAQQSQRDPREYLPFVQSLHTMPELRRKFAIDDHLSRREKALGHLQALKAFDEVQAYTVKHSLYQAALRLYRYEPEHHKTLTDLYAAYLESQSKFREAGLAYESLANYVRATACYRAAGATCWRECLFTALQQTPPLSAGSLADLATALADALYEAKDYASAATIHLEYLSSSEAAVRCFCKGYHFADAMRLVVLRNRADLLESAVDPGLTDALSSSTELLADCKAQLRAQVPRIAELRRRAAEDPLAFYEGERPSALGDVPDDVSVAASSRVSTSASLFTRYTGKAGSVGTVGTGVSRATSKNRRREEKKRARGRKGTVYEEEYLVNSVRRLVERVEATKGEVERLVAGLVRRGMAERARAVEALMEEVVEACRAAVAEVFTAAEPEKASPQGAEGKEAWRPVGADAVMQQSLEAMASRQAPPVVTAFSRLSLLG
ncbi:Elongator complex protein 1 [Pleurostoma richardsiae]|uniref:Elongator complex protein 1 n=1 Tax=Pleurostoma richardsiae TaxID=41990 RepID=A0AA38RLE6_9PEZI|nr:Elongator complex protein 1 [Pleurostoma richardsiae]